MSHKATNRAFQQRGLKPAERVVLLYLADRHNPDHGCFPSQEQLAADCEMSRSGLNVHLDALEEMGLIRRERRVDPATRKQRSTRYILGFEFGATHEPSPDSGHGKRPEPCPEIGESRVQNLDTNPVREPVSTTAQARAVGGEADRLLKAAGPGLCSKSRLALSGSTGIIAEWIEEGFDLELDVVPVIRARTARARGSPVRTWEYFTEAIRRAHARRLRKVRPAVSAETKAEAERVAALDPAERIAEWLRSGTHVPPSAVSNTMRAELLARGLVDEALLRARQIY
jgi:DNA-binding transcriptional ArsR family regulator